MFSRILQVVKKYYLKEVTNMRKNIRIIMIILMVLQLILIGCSSKPVEVRHIPMTEYVEGIYSGINGEGIMINTGQETVTINLTSKVQRQIQEYQLEKNTPVKVKCVIYDEGNGKSKRVAQEIEICK